MTIMCKIILINDYPLFGTKSSKTIFLLSMKNAMYECQIRLDQRQAVIVELCNYKYWFKKCQFFFSIQQKKKSTKLHQRPVTIS